MAFVASKVLWALVQPSNLLLILLAVGIVLGWTRWRHLGRWAAGTATLFLLMLGILPIGGLLYVPLETRFTVPSALPEDIAGIIVLGGATSPSLSRQWGQPIMNNNSERLTVFIALAKHYPATRLVFTGGSDSLKPGKLRQADIVKRLLKELEFKPTVLYERRSRNTYENAKLSHELVTPTDGERWLLITSAFHMPRAIGCFRKAGWNVIAYPTDYRTSGRARITVRLNFSQGLRTFDQAVHEWVGLIAYRLMGRTSHLLPGPSSL